jgi:hypothetical protein
MKLRVHDDGRWALQTGAGDWLLYREGAIEPHYAGALHEPGWHDAIVLTVDDTGARRLAEAWWAAGGIGNADVARDALAALARLAEGGERDA